jgi:hypothetical protein
MTTATILVINTGTSPNSGDGDTLRTAFNKINYNFATLENQIGGVVAFTGTVTSSANLGDLYIIGATIFSTGTDEGIVLSPNGTGTVIIESILQPVQGVKFVDGSLQTTAVNSSTITVSEVTSSTGGNIITNEVIGVSALRFATEAGFTVSDIGGGQAYVSMNSTFKYWEIDGQATLIANGLDTMHFKTGAGIQIVSSATDSPQSIQFNVKPATTTTLGGVIIGRGLSINAQGVLTATNQASTGGMSFGGTTMYPASGSTDVVISNQNGTNGNFVKLPATNDNSTLLTILGSNGVLVTTNTTTSGPIVISPNNGYDGPGDVQIFARGAYDNTAGVYLASADAQVFLYPSDVLPALVSMSAGQNVGVLDIATRVGHTISIRPGGIDNTTGTVYVDGDMVVNSVTVLNGAKIGSATSSTLAGGVAVTSSTYHSSAVALSLSANIQKLTSGAYYLPPGAEGQQVYFAPKNGTNSGTSVTVWFQAVRSFVGGSATTLSDKAWYPFYDSSVGLPYAIYTDGTWNLSTNHIV